MSAPAPVCRDALIAAQQIMNGDKPSPRRAERERIAGLISRHYLRVCDCCSAQIPTTEGHTT